MEKLVRILTRPIADDPFKDTSLYSDDAILVRVIHAHVADKYPNDEILGEKGNTIVTESGIFLALYEDTFKKLFEQVEEPDNKDKFPK